MYILEKTKTWIPFGVFLSLTWIFVRGVHPPLSNFLIEFVFGLVICLPIAYGFRKFFPEYVSIGAIFSSFPYIALFVIVFLRDLVSANIDVAFRILNPSLPIKPAIIVVPLRVKKPFSITTIANSITLTPGTLTLDYIEETNSLLIHTIDGNDVESILKTIHIWEEYALNIFHELPTNTPLKKVFSDSVGGNRG
ncbi:Na+/H+ antiporter subunit E [Candidatus Hikarchaeum yamanae]|uniref:Na+/H+ antiporter subunit E n=1 Tax=Candidatus Hikarchaeum yamanae TaxID=2675326 RepID=UPI0039EC5122|tara:strand:+ start:5862 stop:6443 length:582 start_codon:yes stop_codon:yes gene_type:complete